MFEMTKISYIIRTNDRDRHTTKWGFLFDWFTLIPSHRMLEMDEISYIITTLVIEVDTLSSEAFRLSQSIIKSKDAWNEWNFLYNYDSNNRGRQTIKYVRLFD